MSDLRTIVKNSDKLTRMFGGAWPEFHDAEVDEISFWRGRLFPSKTWDPRNVLPVLTMKVRILEATQPDANHAGNDVLSIFRFSDVDELKIPQLNTINSVLSLKISERDRGKGITPNFLVNFESFATFTCFGIEVLEARPYTNG